MAGKDLVTLAADLAAGYITADFIKEQYGDSILTEVLSFGAGVGVGIATQKLLEVVDNETGIVSDLGSLVDDVFDIF